jgi:uncharacterized membrane protein YfhO
MILLLLLFNLILFAPMLRGLVPLPTDALVGAYYPWAGQFWGFVAGVPYKNISLTDVFSQLYPWRSLAMDLIRHGSLPLWNSLSFSGYPLLANWQSAPFYPLNFLMLIFGNAHGYGIMVFLQPTLAASFMYIFLRQLKLSRVAAGLGGLVSAYSGFVMVYLEYATIGQIMIWLPLILYLIEKYFEKRQIRFLALSSICLFPVLTGGFFQPAFFVILIVSLYFLFRCLSLPDTTKKPRLIVLGAVFVLVGISTAAVQLLPTAELLKYSIRNEDRNIIDYKYGLLPVQNFISFLAPDFFGNPATGNYSGAIQYQEATGYFSVIAVALAILVIFSKKRDWRLNLFTGLFFGSILLAFENPVSRLIYQLNVPLLSTGYASRWLIVTVFAGAYLSAVAIEEMGRKKLIFLLGALLGILVLVYGLIWKAIIPIKPAAIQIASRNLLLPIALLMASIAVCFLIKNKNWAKWLLLILVAFDLGRFTVKFTPFSDPEYTKRAIPVFEYIKSQADVGRVITENGPILPANTWIYPNLYSPSGYDPLLIRDYAVFYRGLNMGQQKTPEAGNSLGEGLFTRYLNIVNLNSSLLDLVGAKYLLTVKYDPYGKIRPWGNVNGGAIDLRRYKPVFEDGESVVLQNQTALPRAGLFYEAESETDSTKAAEKLVAGFDFRTKLLINKENLTQYLPGKNDTAEITSYSADRVDLQAKTQNGAYLFLSDTFFPGWQVYINGKSGEILRADSVFRAVEIPPGDTHIEMIYLPESFKVGVIISIISLTTLLILTFKKSLTGSKLV